MNYHEEMVMTVSLYSSQLFYTYNHLSIVYSDTVKNCQTRLDVGCKS